jgi:hypothetical protein
MYKTQEKITTKKTSKNKTAMIVSRVANESIQNKTKLKTQMKIGMKYAI